MDFSLHKSSNDDIMHIIMEQNIQQFVKISDDIYNKKYNYHKFYKYINRLEFIKKYILFVVHFSKSFKGEKYTNLKLYGEMKIKEIWANINISKKFKSLIFYNGDKFTFEILNMKGFSTKYIRKIKNYELELKHKKNELFVSKQKIAFVKSINNFLPDDLLEYTCSYLMDNRKIINLKNIHQNIMIGVTNTKSYFDILQGENYNNIFCYTWKLSNDIYDVNLSYLRPGISFVKKYQVLPFIFKHERYYDSCDGDCDYCNYKIDYPRELYLYKKHLYENRHIGKHSNFYNNWILFQYCLHCTTGRVRKRSGFISVYNRTRGNRYYKNRYDKSKSHIVIKNNIDKWKQLENIWSKIKNND